MRKLVVLAVLVTACASGGSGGGTTTPTASPQQAAQPPRVWPVLTRKHVDLWLHGYAMLLRDTTTVPVFRRGYRARLDSMKAQRGLRTQLDVNRERLQSRLSLSPAIFNGQFAPMYFASWDQMQQVIRLFLQAEGNPRATNDPTLAQFFAVLAQSFGAPADREWLRLFTDAVEDERRQYYDVYWNTENSGRMGLVRQADSLWQGKYRQRMQRFLNNTQQENGDFILALTLGGEGRTVNFGSRQNAIASTMPSQEAAEAIYVFVHEAVNALVSTAVSDNTTPAEQREGVAAKYVTAGTVRAGALLLDRTAKELLPGYTRYYLSQAGLSTAGDINARLAATFPLPDGIRQAIERQLDVILGGI